jgi:hypothetical protein
LQCAPKRAPEARGRALDARQHRGAGVLEHRVGLVAPGEDQAGFAQRLVDAREDGVASVGGAAQRDALRIDVQQVGVPGQRVEMVAGHRAHHAAVDLERHARHFAAPCGGDREPGGSGIHGPRSSQKQAAAGGRRLPA